MNTPAHLLIGWAAFGRKHPYQIAIAALIGALLPDLSLYLMAGTSLFLLNIPPSVVFGELYFSSTWQTVFAIDNSFIVWGTLLGLAVAMKKDWAIALCGAALLHLALDLPLHHDDGRAHFWPVSNWIFESPVSYWDHRHHAAFVGPMELALAAGCSVAIIGRRYWRPTAIPVALLLVMEAVVIIPGYFWTFE